MNIGRAIKLCRSQRGWTLAELGKLAGIAPSHLSMVERGERDPSMTSVETISKALGIPVNVLVFLAADTSELSGITEDLKEKLSHAAIELLKLPAANQPL